MKMNGSVKAHGVPHSVSWRKALAWLGLLPVPKPAPAPMWLALQQGALRRVSGDQFNRIECLKGVVWVTEGGRADDLMLKAGRRCFLTGSGPVLIQALAPAQVLLHS